MVLQASGDISFSDLRTEFDGATEVKFSDYYRTHNNTPYVASIPDNYDVPRSGSPIGLEPLQ